MPRAKKSGKNSEQSTPIAHLKHDDQRANIPTEELRGFVETEPEQATMRYPRDPSLDPQLVWKGKDEQDGQDLEVPTVPLYIQEHIHPHALIEEFRRDLEGGESDQNAAQLDLFATTFEGGLDFDARVDFYNHAADWSNRMILGDSLVVMNSLAEKEQLRGKVQCIYMDPPYGIKFGSNWQVSTRKRDVKDGKLEETTRQPEQIRAFRDTWELGIHSYLSYLRDRLMVARELLTETGSCFVQIGDENVHLVRCLMDEVFGSENFMANIVLQKSGGLGMSNLKSVCDYVIFYAKNLEKVKYKQIFNKKEVGIGHGSGARYDRIQEESGLRRSMTVQEKLNPQLINAGMRPYRHTTLNSMMSTASCVYPIDFQGKIYNSPVNRQWSTTELGVKRLISANRVEATGKSPNYVRYLDDFTAYEISNVWTDVAGASGKIYIVQTTPIAIQRCILMTTDPGDLVLDPTCGSGTTAYVAEQWGRRWITIDTSRVALALARTRLMAAKYPYYLLKDSPEGAAKTAELAGQPVAPQPTKGDLKKGFVYRTVPHITLKAIANNEAIDTIHEKWQAKLEPCRAELNRHLGQTWQEWEIPREATENWPAAAKKQHADWWRWRRQRQQEIDDAIARRADQETLYDQPYEDKKRLRVTGPFTVESLSPHRVLDPEAKPSKAEQAGRTMASDRFETRIIENLQKAGVQNTKKGERLEFETLEPYVSNGRIQAAGEYLDKNGDRKTVAVAIGPEYGTVGSDDIREAAKEAVKGLGFDTLVVCGFAFDASVTEESKKYGRLPILITRINPDLMLDDTLLKKTSAANLFVVFGEPDLAINRLDDGQYTVTLNGLDIYDPTTGEIRSSTTNDIAAWFIDTRYNEESFYVRHAYFTGADRPYEKLQKTLKAEIDPDAWEVLYSTTSRPFPKPSNGKIAIKVINHYGDEVLKVYDLA
jgi:adenine-specific DNA-methyltransferase